MELEGVHLRQSLLAGVPVDLVETSRSRPSIWRTILTSPPFHVFLFLLTACTTLVTGVHIVANYSRGLPAFDWNFSESFFVGLARHPAQLVAGVPFALTLLTILLAHEFGHYFTCRYYRIRATYPYFIPAPTLIGTMGAFIRLKSPVRSRRCLFDVGISGPLAGFVVALPALIFSILQSRPAVAAPHDSLRMGHSAIVIVLTRLLRPGVGSPGLSLDPVGCAAWVGLLATMLNLLPIGQLDGGHILYAVFGNYHKGLSRGFLLALVPLGVFYWPGWIVWGLILLVLGLRHPMVMLPSEPLDRARKLLAVIAAVIFVLSFTPVPFSVH